MKRKIFVPVWLALLTGLAGGCAQSSGPGTIYDIPRVENISIDGNAADWGDRGFRVDALGRFEGQPRPIDQFDQKLRFAWDDRGLLLLANVRDSLVLESPASSRAWEKTNVAIFVAASAGSKLRYQVVVGSGVDDQKQPVMRTSIGDFRDPKPTPQPAPILAKSKTADGYIVEALLPWDSLGIVPKDGAQCAINVVVNSIDSRGISLRVGWLADGASEMDSKIMYTLRLADHPSPTVSYSAATSLERARWIDAIVRVGPRTGESPIALAVRNSQGELAHAVAPPSSESRDIVMKVPMTPPSTRYGLMTITADGQTIATANLDEEMEKARKDVFERANFRFHDWVFDGEEFPSGDFDQPDTVLDAIGNYKVQTSYYDTNYNEVKTAAKAGRYGAVTVITTDSGLTMRKVKTLYRLPGKLDWEKAAMSFGVHFPVELGIDAAIATARSQQIDDFLKYRFVDGFSEESGTAILLSALSEPRAPGPDVNRTSLWSIDRKWIYGLDKKLGQPIYPYAVNLPEKYDADPKARWPVIVFLHGSGQRGIPLEKYRTDTTVVEIANNSRGRFILISPICPEHDYWNPWELSDLLDEVSAKYRIDPDRIYLTGLSMGGGGTWDMGMAFPEKFAAIVPLCGIGDLHDMERIKDLPVWAFHGMDDDAVSFVDDKAGIEALQKAGGRVRFTAYPGVFHNCWTKGYATAELYDWLLQQRRGKPTEPPYSARP